MKKLFALPLALVVALALVAVVGVTPAMADTIIGISSTPTDWSAEVEENTNVGNATAPFDSILLFSESGPGVLSVPGLADVDSDGWTNTDVVPGVYSALTGSTVSDIFFDINFANPGTNIYFNLYTLADGVVVDSASFNNAGYGTPFGEDNLYITGAPGQNGLNCDLQNSGAVPEPATFALIGAALIGLGFKRWGHKRP